MGGNKAVISNGGVMANMISAPQNNIVLNITEWLDRVVFKNETMFANFYVRPHK